MVACSETGSAIRTGIELPNLDAFDTAALARRTTVCPHCGRQHRWGKTDAWLDASGSTGQLAAGEGLMTFDDLCKLPNGTPVQLLDGLIGRMAVWHKAQRAVGVIVPGEGLLRTLSAGQLRRRADGATKKLALSSAVQTSRLKPRPGVRFDVGPRCYPFATYQSRDAAVAAAEATVRKLIDGLPSGR